MGEQYKYKGPKCHSLSGPCLFDAFPFSRAKAQYFVIRDEIREI